jgi:hypothetical protein
VKVINSAVDKIIGIIISSLLGATFISKEITKLVTRHKWKVFLIIVGVPSIIILSIFIFIGKIYAIIQDPLSIFFQNSSLVETVEVYKELPPELIGYIEPGFINTGIPHNSPFGRKGIEWTYITAGFHDVNYTISFGHEHNAIDIVPNSEYYKNNQAYKLYKDVVMFATCSGNATSLRDGNGANYIYIVCNEEKYSLIFLHNKINFIDSFIVNV